MTTRMFPIILAIIATLSLSILGFYFFSDMKEEPKQQRPPERLLKVTVAEVKYDTLTTKIISTGRLESRSFVDLISEVSGKILPGDVPLKKGQSFQKGQVLVRIFSEEAVLALKGRKSRYLTTLANMLPDMLIDFTSSYPAWETFFNNIELDKDLPELPKISNSKEKIFLSGRNIISEYYAIQSDEIRLTKYELVAPFKGAFNEVYLETGAVVNMGSKLAKMIRTDILELEVAVNYDLSRKIRVGQKVNVSTDDDKFNWVGSVNRKSEFIDPTTQSISIFVTINQNKDPLFKGMYMKAEFGAITYNSVMKLPRNAVFNQDEVYFVNEDMKLAKSKIDIVKYNETTLFFRGLTEGTLVVNEPLINVTEDIPVEILKK